MANFKPGSRYTNGTFTLSPEDSEFLILREKLDIPESSEDIFFIVEGEHIYRPELIAIEVYDRPELWWAIADINNIKEPMFDLEVGQELRIPPLSAVLQALDVINK